MLLYIVLNKKKVVESILNGSTPLSNSKRQAVHIPARKIINNCHGLSVIRPLAWPLFKSAVLILIESPADGRRCSFPTGISKLDWLAKVNTAC